MERMLRPNGVWYWVGTAAVLVFGVVSIFSFGWLFLTAGIVMAVAGVTGWAISHPQIFWSPMKAAPTTTHPCGRGSAPAWFSAR